VSNLTLPPMNRFIFISSAFVAFAFVALFSSPLQAEEAEQPPQQAELLRTVSGTRLGPNGFSAGQVRLERGMIYDVKEKKGFSSVVLLVDGDSVEVRESDLRISDKAIKEPDPVTGFVPGRIILRSAYYGAPVERPRNNRQVLRVLQSMVPRNDIDKPVEVLVTDALLGRDAAYQSIKGSMSGQMDIYGNVSGNVQMQKPKKNVLVVEYQYNGQFLKKSAIEEGVLILP